MSHCLLAQVVTAQGRAKANSAIVNPVLQFCIDNNINVFQMPCPELLCSAGGFNRQRRGKKWYERHGLRSECKTIAKQQAGYITKLMHEGVDVLGIIGVEFSPACSPNYLNRGRITVRGKGIYVEELQRELLERNIEVRFIGVNKRWAHKLKEDLTRLL